MFVCKDDNLKDVLKIDDVIGILDVVALVLIEVVLEAVELFAGGALITDVSIPDDKTKDARSTHTSH